MQPVRLWAAGLLITCAAIPKLGFAAEPVPAKPSGSTAATSKAAVAAPKKPLASKAAPAKEAPKTKKPATRGDRAQTGGAPVTPRPMERTQRRVYGEAQGDEELRAGGDDPELQGLRDAERALFPRPLLGVEPGWSWDLPRPLPSRGPEVSNSGAPPNAPASRSVTPEGDGTLLESEWLRTLVLPNFTVRLDEYVAKYLKFYRDEPKGQGILRVWAKKSGKYTDILRAELAKAGVPTDLLWLTLIESGHNATSVSPAGAAGLWQFMPDAGRSYGLVIDRWVDERLDPERATEAAARYLGELYRRFGSWELALAAYNMGHGGLVKAIRKFNTNDFWRLSRFEAGVPWETALYVPKIVATAIAMNNRRSFGIDSVPKDTLEVHDVVQVGPSILLEDVAKSAGVSLETLAELNPQYLAGRTPPWQPGTPVPSWRIKLPARKGAAATAALARGAMRDESLQAYLTKIGDTVESVALSHGTTEARIRNINHVEPKEILAPGTLLLVPRQAERSPANPTQDNVIVVSARQFAYEGRSRLFYRAVSGDTLGKVAAIFGVSTWDLCTWNTVDEAARLQSGMVLQLFVPNNKDLSRVRHIPEREARVLVAGTPDFYDYFESRSGRRRLAIAAKDGETLAAIGKKYGMTVGQMERVNRRSRSDKLRSGETLIVYADRDKADMRGSAKLAKEELPKRSDPQAAIPFPEALPSLESASGLDPAASDAAE